MAAQSERRIALNVILGEKERGNALIGRGGHSPRQNHALVRITMPPRTRKLVGTVALIAMITVYAFIALGVAVVLQVSNSSKIVELAFYVIAGLLWVLPAGILIKWMQKSGS